MALFLATPESGTSAITSIGCETPVSRPTLLSDENSDSNMPTPVINLDDKLASPGTPAPSAESESEAIEVVSSEEKRRQELEESERLAWQLMQEESMSAYEMQASHVHYINVSSHISH